MGTVPLYVVKRSHLQRMAPFFVVIQCGLRGPQRQSSTPDCPLDATPHKEQSQPQLKDSDYAQPD